MLKKVIVIILCAALIFTSCSPLKKALEDKIDERISVKMERETNTEVNDSGTIESSMLINPEKLKASDQGVLIEFSPIDISFEDELEIKELSSLDTSSFGENVSVKAYDITLGENKEFIAPVKISIPYDVNKIEAGQNPRDCVDAGYYDPELGMWESIYFSIDTDTNMVNISTNHLSTYAVFTFSNPGERIASAYASGIGATRALIDLGSFEYDDVLQEYVDYYGETGKDAFNVGLSIINNEFALAGNAITIKDVLVGDMVNVERFSSALERLGMAAALYQLASDYESGNNVAMVSNGAKNIAYYLVGKFGSNIAKACSVGVFAIDYSLNSLMAEAVSDRENAYYLAYELYYNEKLTNGYKSGNSVERQFYKKFYDAYVKNLAEGGEQKDLDKKIDKIIDQYVNEFWQDEAVIGMYFQMIKNDNTIGTSGGGLNEKLKAEITKAAKAELINTTLQPIFATLSKNIKQELFNDYMENIRELESMVNEIYRIEIYEKGDEKKFANGKFRFSPLATGVDSKYWTGTLDGNAQALTGFTVLGYMQGGLPNKIEFFTAEQSLDEEAKYVAEFKVSDPLDTIEVAIGSSAFSLDDLVGEWTDKEKCKFTVNESNLDWDALRIIVENESSSKVDDQKLKEIGEFYLKYPLNSELGITEKITFTIEKLNETEGILRVTDLSKTNQRNWITIPWRFTFKDGQIIINKGLVEEYIRENFEGMDFNVKIISIESDIYSKSLDEFADNKIVGISGDLRVKINVGDRNLNEMLPFDITCYIEGERIVPNN